MLFWQSRAHHLSSKLTQYNDLVKGPRLLIKSSTGTSCLTFAYTEVFGSSNVSSPFLFCSFTSSLNLRGKWWGSIADEVKGVTTQWSHILDIDSHL